MADPHNSFTPRAKALQVATLKPRIWVERIAGADIGQHDYPLTALEIGDMIRVPVNERLKVRNACLYTTRITGRKYKTSTVQDEVYVWRVK